VHDNEKKVGNNFNTYFAGITSESNRDLYFTGYNNIVSVLEIKKANTKFDYFLIVKQVFLWLSVATMIVYQLNPLWKLDFIKVATSIGILIFSLDTLLRIFRKSEYQSNQEQNRWQTFFYFSIFWIGVLITINN